MYNLNWSRSDLTRQKLGTFCEYYAKMSLASYGVSIYTSEVDDHGIDFIAESKREFLKFQVKAIRKGTGYVFMREEYFDISDQSLYLFLLLLNDGEHPIEYLIPATTWDNDSSNIFVYHSYKGKKSKPPPSFHSRTSPDRPTAGPPPAPLSVSRSRTAAGTGLSLVRNFPCAPCFPSVIPEFPGWLRAVPGPHPPA